jgi:hypothetical protein
LVLPEPVGRAAGDGPILPVASWERRIMPRKPNYRFERHERERVKAAKKAARAEAKAAKAEQAKAAKSGEPEAGASATPEADAPPQD